MGAQLVTTPADVVRISKVSGLSDLAIAYAFGIGSRYTDSKERFAYLDERDPNWFQIYKKKEDDRYYAQLKRTTDPKRLWKMYEWGEGQDRVEDERSSSGPRGDVALKRIVEVLTPKLAKAAADGVLKDMVSIEKLSPRGSGLRKVAIRAICQKVNGQNPPTEDDALISYAAKSGILLGDVLWAFELPSTIFDRKTVEAKTFQDFWWVVTNNPHLSQNWACAIKGQDWGKRWTTLWGKPGSEERKKMIREIREVLALYKQKPLNEWFLLFQFILWDAVPSEEEIELLNDLAEPWIVKRSKDKLDDVKSLVGQLGNSHPFKSVIKKERVDRLQQELFNRVEHGKFPVTPDSVRSCRWILEDMDENRQQRILDSILQGVDRKIEQENRISVLRSYQHSLHDGVFGTFRGVYAKRRQEMSKRIIEKVTALKTAA